MDRQKAFALLGMDQLAPPAEVPVLEADPGSERDESEADCPLAPPAAAELELLHELREWDPDSTLGMAIALAERYGSKASFEVAFSCTSALDERARISSLLSAAGLRHTPGGSSPPDESSGPSSLIEACKRVARGDGGDADDIIQHLEEMPPTQKVEPTEGAEVARAVLGLVASGDKATSTRTMAALAARMPAPVVKRMSKRELQDVRLARELTRRELSRGAPIDPATVQLLAEGVSQFGARPNEVIADINHSEYPIIRRFLKDRPALSGVYEPHLLTGLDERASQTDTTLDGLWVRIILFIIILVVTLWGLALSGG